MHLEVIRERLEREYGVDLITTAPSVVYRMTLTDGSEVELHNPADMPDPVKIDSIAEPWIKATILVPDEYLGGVLKLCEDRRGVQKSSSPMPAAGPCWSTNCRSMRWCSISTTG